MSIFVFETEHKSVLASYLEEADCTWHTFTHQRVKKNIEKCTTNRLNIQSVLLHRAVRKPREREGDSQGIATVMTSYPAANIDELAKNNPS